MSLNPKKEQQKIFDNRTRLDQKPLHKPGWAYDKVYLRNILEALNLKPEDRFLEVGCGIGKDLSLLQCYVDERVGLDLSSESLRKAKKRASAHYVIADAGSLPFSSGKFRKVLCSHVIEHLQDQKKALMEIKRILCENGKIFLLTPNRNGLPEKLVGMKEKLFLTNERKIIGHINLRSLDEFVKLLKSINGLKILSISSSGIFWPGGLSIPVFGRFMSSAPLILLIDKLSPGSAEKLVMAEQKITSKTALLKIGWDMKFVLTKKS